MSTLGGVECVPRMHTFGCNRQGKRELRQSGDCRTKHPFGGTLAEPGSRAQGQKASAYQRTSGVPRSLLIGLKAM